MQNIINTIRQKLSSVFASKHVKNSVDAVRLKPQLAFAGGIALIFVISLFTQGLGGSTLVQSLVAALGGGLSGAVTALILVALKMLFSREGLKFIAALVGVGIVLAVLTSAAALEIAVPPLAGFVAYLAALIFMLKAFVQFKPRTELPMIFGTARWAKHDDLTKAEMIVDGPTGANLDNTGTSGLFLGQHPETNEAIIYDGDMHAITIAPTRTGKDQTAILPNLVRSQGSFLVVDPKGESARLSAKRRSEMGGKVMIVDPWGIATIDDLQTDTCTQNARFNPLDRLSADDPDLAGDVMLYADALVMSESQNPHWPNEAKALIAGFIAYIVSDPLEAQRRNLGRLRDILCLPLAQRDENGNVKDETADTLDEILGRMIASDIGFVKNSAYRFLQKEERERASVVATAQANTHFLESPRIRESLSKSDFAFADLKAETATTVYLALPLDRMNAFGRWLRLLISTALVELTRTVENKQAHPVRFIMNEFAALGRLESVETAFGTMAGLGVQLWAITQDLSQLKRLYGADNWQTFVANAGVFQYFGSRDYETAKYAEHLCGLSTLKKRSTSFGTNWSKGASNSGPSVSHGSSETVSIDDVQRPLIFADELMRLPRDQQLLLIENLPPVMAHKWWWYRNQPKPEETAAPEQETPLTTETEHDPE